MFLKLVFIFVVVPIAELFLLLKLGQAIGLWPTLGIVILTGVVGAYLARYEGMGIMNRIGAELAGGRVPQESLIEALLIFVGGLLLLTPGILTDLFGFSLLFPPARKAYRNWLKRKFRYMAEREETKVTYILH